MKLSFSKLILLGIFAFLMIAINGCDALYWNEGNSRERVQRKTELVVLSLPGAQQDRDLVQNFAHVNSLRVRYQIYPNQTELLAALQRGAGDMAIGRLRTPESSGGFLLGPAYEDTSLSLFCRTQIQIANIRDLNGKKVALLAKDSSEEFVRRLMQFAPQLNLEWVADQSARALVRFVQDKKFDCAIIEKLEGRIATRYAPAVEYITDLSEKYSLRWYLAPDNYDLRLLMNAWFQQASRNDEIMRVMDRYQAYLDELNESDLRRFRRSLAFELRDYKKIFVAASQRHKIPWQLIAAVAYQESHWNADAQSFTGVRGFMQLTTDTAAHLGVTDRDDAEQSIHGGAKYLRYLFDKTPPALNTKDRWALALAAYNIGYAHLRDAQKLTQSFGKDPHSWRALRLVLPLLTDSRYSAELEFGPARGNETVEFVDRVRSFYNYML